MKEEHNHNLMTVTVYSSDLPINGYEVLHDVIEVTKTADGKKYRIKTVISHGMGTDFQYHYYNARNTEIHI